MFSIPYALSIGRLTAHQLLIVAAVEGVLFITFGLANTASFKRVVPVGQAPTAIAQIQAFESVSRIVGPTLGGGLFALSRSLPFIVDAVSYVVSVLAVLCIRTPLTPERSPEDAASSPEFMAGVTWPRGQPAFLELICINGAVNVVCGGYPLLVIALAQRPASGPSTIGLLIERLGAVGTVWVMLVPSVLLAAVATGAAPLRHTPRLAEIGAG